MSTCLSSKNGVKARKRYRCCLCGEGIDVGEIHDTRTGVVDGDGFWTMRIHTECHAYEQKPGVVDPSWYEDIMEPAFKRQHALAAMLYLK